MGHHEVKVWGGDGKEGCWVVLHVVLMLSILGLNGLELGEKRGEMGDEG